MSAKVCLHCGSTNIAISYPASQDLLLITCCRDCRAKGKTVELSEDAMLRLQRRIRRT